ncbi:hypothetical protein GGQ74_002941 [Desulfobaculum xiamenense]|uniref:Uncharacterized protein n=1 Tax=Desulfobaculum xiamenense TaxID=995050 RepID=A0A846QVV0_9BACT|nr:hypothetical protein [Desulfobaculum xiamenense]NJB69244.1 hypothetical protein [Desulfobaculum xiamenense]
MIDRERLADRRRIGMKLLRWHSEQAPHIKRITGELSDDEAMRLRGKLGTTRVSESRRRKKNKDAMSLREMRQEQDWPWYDF